MAADTDAGSLHGKYDFNGGTSLISPATVIEKYSALRFCPRKTAGTLLFIKPLERFSFK
ncbi:MAG: hypothetical protein LBD67_00650 [Candidatus Accumulibacter sp.]|jgi:hypothetical protein|nr:hypothetical protein [Accumulibacter sp.]